MSIFIYKLMDSIKSKRKRKKQKKHIYQCICAFSVFCWTHSV